MADALFMDVNEPKWPVAGGRFSGQKLNEWTILLLETRVNIVLDLLSPFRA